MTNGPEPDGDHDTDELLRQLIELQLRQTEILGEIKKHTGCMYQYLVLSLVLGVVLGLIAGCAALMSY